MSKTVIEGRKVTVNRPKEMLYSVFSDLTNFSNNLSSELFEQYNVVASKETIAARVQGFEVGIEICSQEPYNKVVYKQYGATPFEFTITINLQEEPGNSVTTFQFVLEMSLPIMYKMLIGNKIQEGIDKITQELEKALK